MPFNRIVLLTSIGILWFAGCGPTPPFEPKPRPLPTPGGTWVIALSQSGGFAGVHLTVEVSSSGELQAQDLRSGHRASAQLPIETITELNRLVATMKAPPTESLPSVCADCFIYELTVTSPNGVVRVQVDDTTIANSGAQPLITLLRSLRDDALAAAQ